ncbi:hypothetical protein LWF15_33530 [Kineosporia rhizophila]|uniref:hypothetical protein n=1 Tax=Kineosporia rhizophila TaxID=84633 RepID=UPI001E4A763C|nr:hypothetical protein [Kineosporia rhizophila]MCE0540427.1 hypothetical protein [Kineosporia rhizophila]
MAFLLLVEALAGGGELGLQALDLGPGGIGGGLGLTDALLGLVPGGLDVLGCLCLRDGLGDLRGRVLRSERAERSQQLAAAVRDGWDDDRVRDVLLHIDPAQGLFF